MEKIAAEMYVFIVTGIVVMASLSGFIIYFIIAYRRKQILVDKEKTEMRSHFDKQILQTQLEIQEQTLKNISQEIHDNVGQVLTLAKLNLATITIEEPVASEKIRTSQRLIGKSIQDLRDLSRSLNTDYVAEMGFVRSVEYELEMLQKTGSVDATFEVRGENVKIERQKELVLFRILQEAIHNVIRHAEAKHIQVKIVFTADAVSILINDDGKGFDITPLQDYTNNKFGLGLRNMRGRATLIGAWFSVSSTIGEGTEVKLELPINHHINEGTT